MTPTLQTKIGDPTMLRSALPTFRAALFGGMIFCATGAMADVLTVYLDGSGDYTSIQGAIDASTDGDTILIGPGSYDESLNTGGKNITLRGINGYPQTILDPGGDSATLLTINGGETGLLIEGMTFRNGQNSSMTEINNDSTADFVSCRWLGGTASSGAGLLMSGATVSFTDCQWLSNQTTNTGGAIDATNCTLTFTGGKFITNQNSGQKGGAMWVADCTLDMTGTEFTSNQCNSGSTSGGGAIYMRTSSGTWTDCVFEGNSASSDQNAFGGDVQLEEASPVVTGCTFTGGEASVYRNAPDNYTLNSEGGSFYLGGSSSPVYSNTTFNSCIAKSETINPYNCNQGLRYSNARSRGGAIYCSSSCNASFLNTQFVQCESFATGNGVSGCTNNYRGHVSTCAYGGAIWANNASPILNNCTFDNCSSTRSSSGNTHGTNIAYGGSIYLENLASPTILGTSFAGSGSQYGAVIYATSQSSPFVSNSTFVGNTSSDRAGAIYSNDASPSFATCLFQANTASSGGAFYIDGSAGYFPQVGGTTFCGNAPSDFSGQYIDDEGNVFLAECGDDCNGNGISDAYEVETGDETDCNGNGALDSCEIEAKPGLDCDQDGILDACQAAGGNDCDGDGVLDDCEADCDGDGTPDDCQILEGSGSDCDTDGTLDACQIADDPSLDCNGNGLPDACDPDCDGDGTADECQIAGDPSIDCNGDDIPDFCQIASGDVNNDGVLDDCQPLDFTGIEVEIAPITGVVRDDGSLMPLSAVCYRIYATFDDPAAHLIGLYGSPNDGSMIFTTGGGLYQDPEGGDLASERPCDENGLYPELAFDSLLTVGGDCGSTASETQVGIDFTGFNTTGSMVANDGIVLINPGDPQGAPDADGRVLVAQLTSLDGSRPEGRFNLIGTNGDGSDFQALQVTWGQPALVDCNGNGLQDAFDIGGGGSLDCNLDGVPDECQTKNPDRDCNGNGTPDWCDISRGVSADDNGNGIPDECECEGDLNGDGTVNVDDIIIVILAWGMVGDLPADANNDGMVDGQDLGLVINAFGGCA